MTTLVDVGVVTDSVPYIGWDLREVAVHSCPEPRSMRSLIQDII